MAGSVADPLACADRGSFRTGFIDRQLNGPFNLWQHRHRFEAVGPQKTVVHDEVTATLSAHWFWKLVGLGMWLNMPILFAFRGWKTRRLLENRTDAPTPLAHSDLS
ncbi:MAG: hypothetical protein R2932_22235 [Caldilineaceae bacterium]